MPRKARIDAPGALHHIIVRGIEKCPIFRDNRDREQFIERLGNILSDTVTPCYAWALIPNHFHLLLKTGMTPIATVMRRLLTGHAVYFNRRYRRNGHLFQNRYKSILCQEENYLIELVRYIHLNPLRAGLVKDLNTLSEYPYCGHSALTGKQQRYWQQQEYVLKYFGQNLPAARKAYLRFMENGVNQGRRLELTGGGLLRSLGGWQALKTLRQTSETPKGDERILGDNEFVDAVLQRENEQLELRYRLKAQGFGLDNVAEQVAKTLNLSIAEVWEKSRRPPVVQARSLLCYWATRTLGMTATEIAKNLDQTQPAISVAVRRGENLVKEKGYKLEFG